MNKQEAFSYYASQLEDIRNSGVLKAERIITTPQSAHIFADGKELLNMCANNYLGLADNRELAEAAKAAYDTYGYGMASVRFICGTQSIPKSWRQPSPGSWGPRTPSSTPPALMPTAACSRFCSPQRTQSSATS